MAGVAGGVRRPRLPVRRIGCRPGSGRKADVTAERMASRPHGVQGVLGVMTRGSSHLAGNPSRARGSSNCGTRRPSCSCPLRARSNGKPRGFTVTHGRVVVPATWVSTAQNRRTRSLPSWSREFDSRRPLSSSRPSSSVVSRSSAHTSPRRLQVPRATHVPQRRPMSCTLPAPFAVFGRFPGGVPHLADERAQSLRDRLVTVTRGVLVDHRCAYAGVPEPRHQLFERGAGRGRERAPVCRRSWK